jgi:hypothetical protein
MSGNKTPRNIAINTPGESPVVDDPITEALEPDLLGEPITTQDLSDDDFEAEVERRAQLRFSQLVAKQRKADPVAHLPDQSEIDATKLKRSVLTKQGYVVPAPPALDAATEALRKVMAR